MERELEQARQEARITRDEMQTFQEEARCANEEMQSMNEELQSTNEELQMLNHELNAQGERPFPAEQRHEEPARQHGTHDLVPRQRTQRAAFHDRIEQNLQADARRRGPADHGHRLRPGLYSELADDAREVLRTLVSHEQQLATRDGHWFMMRIMPYRTLENMIDGVVITFVDITVSKTLEAELRKTQADLYKQIDEQGLKSGSRADRPGIRRPKATLRFQETKAGPPRK